MSAASGTRIEPLGRVRRITAERMAASARTVARVTLTTTVDMAEAVRFQAQLEPGARATLRCAPRLRRDDRQGLRSGVDGSPTLNARWRDSDPRAVELLQRREHRCGRCYRCWPGGGGAEAADARPLHALPAICCGWPIWRSLGRSSPDDVSGGTFTITNLGAYGVEAFTPIINPPEAAILGVGAIARRPAVVGDAVVPREQMTLSLSFDHRVNDRAPAAAFLKRVREILEAPYILLT